LKLPVFSPLPISWQGHPKRAGTRSRTERLASKRERQDWPKTKSQEQAVEQIWKQGW
jgi:hypothetical protein